ncbi:BglII/BstYI family type II restriction endonuclease [Phenylobacterium sp.]|uniref:BglII/BstYI family type II restriction endonuclease n=1 Tax=Phenylobacterium sp. TaxID=1871053 RepID=UPI0025EC6119|nr:BglII/BstYI family type II restriction endonuclease [Phenylobacterium sp.]MCA3723692.1 restriction endonuclease [Phenylobacterium sp.]MCA6261837.1 restriction endonuclease [Phenylobacterium sp.]
MFERLIERGFQVEFRSHARAILALDFPGAAEELEAALLGATIPIEEIIAGGGGEAKGTQRLRRALDSAGWRKMEFVVETRINGVARESQSHEVDHVRELTNGDRIALEIEWNNKDPFYDRDLENFQRLHANGAISVGAIITRGRSLHENMRSMVGRFLEERQILDLEGLREWGYDPTSRQRDAIGKRMTRKKKPMSFREAFVEKFVADKFGEATTHWRKLDDRLRRGIGNPCPLLLIGLPDNIVTFHEGATALAEVQAGELNGDPED